MSKKIYIFSLILAFIFAILLQTNVFAANHTLNEIADKFNNSNSVKTYGNLLNTTFSASTVEAKPNVLTILLTTDKGTSSVDYQLNNSVLSYGNLDDSNLITAYLLADSIGQLNGYADGEIMKFFNMFTDELSSYTIENTGFEIKKNGSSYSVKMDIDKKIPLIDESEFYLKPEEFDIIAEIMKKGTYGNQNGKNSKLVYNIIIREDKNEIYMGEENETTQSTYKSILSALKVIYGDKVVEYFKSIYPKFVEDEIAELDGFTIETDVNMDLNESPIFTGTKVVKVVADNKYITDKFLRDEFIGETINRGDKTITLDFTKNKVYKLGFFDSASSSDVAFLYKNILEPAFTKANAKLVDNTVYFNIENGKIVVGDKNNSILKIVVTDDSIEISAPKEYTKKTTATAVFMNIKVKEYEKGAESEDHFRYGKYDKITLNIIYGPESETKNDSKKDTSKDDNKDNTSKNVPDVDELPKTGSTISFAISAITLIAVIGVIYFKKYIGLKNIK